MLERQRRRENNEGLQEELRSGNVGRGALWGIRQPGNPCWSRWIFPQGTAAHGEPVLEQVFSCKTAAWE